MILVDVHAHMDFPDYAQDLDRVIEQNRAAGVAAIVSNGVTPESNRKVLELARKYDIIRPALGIYPTHCPEMSPEEFDQELEFISKQDIAAVGEVGLDYLDVTHKQRMRECFEQFIALAEKKRVPIIVHSRKAELDCVEMLESSKNKRIVMHCFMGRQHLVKRIIDNGWTLSIPCIVTKLSQLQDNVKLAPISQLLTETDAPYLSPVPEVRRNEPRFVAQSVEKISQLKGLDPNETSKMIYMNYKKMFT